MNTMNVSSNEYLIEKAPEISLPESLDIENLLTILDYARYIFVSKYYADPTHVLIHPETLYHYMHKIYRECPEIVLRDKTTRAYVLNGMEMLDIPSCPKGLILLYREESRYSPLLPFASGTAPKVMKIVLTTDLSE